MKVRFSRLSRTQLVAIHNFLSERNPAAAHRAGRAIWEAIEVIRAFPFAGRVGRAPDTREWVIAGFPYIVVYEVDEGQSEITVLGVFHGAQDR